MDVSQTLLIDPPVEVYTNPSIINVSADTICDDNLQRLHISFSGR